MALILKRWAVCLLPFLFLTTTASVWSQTKPKWRIKNRLQIGYEFDDNIRETASDTLNHIEDSSLRLLFNSRATRRSPTSNLAFTYRGGLQSYFRNSIENKFINEISLSTGFRAAKTVIGVRGFGRLKNYLNDFLDYASGSLEAFVQLPQVLQWNTEIAVSAGGIDYQSFPSFNYSENEVKWLFSKGVSRRISVSVLLAGKWVRYDRDAIEIPEESMTVILNEPQRDRSYRAQLRLNYSKSFLINVIYAIQSNTSNSVAFEFTRHQVTLIFGVPLAKGLWLRGYGAAQFKNYRENLALLFPIEVDSERDESNFFTIDLSKDFSSTMSLLLRFASYNNESVIRNVFYRKNLFTLGADFRF